MWHELLRNSMATGDHITGQVLDLVEKPMLVGRPEHRIKSKQLLEELKKIMETSTQEDPPKIILEALRESEEAPWSDAGTSQANSSTQPSAGTKDTLPLRGDASSSFDSAKKTAQRSKYLESRLEPTPSKDGPVDNTGQPTSGDPGPRPSVSQSQKHGSQRTRSTLTATLRDHLHFGNRRPQQDDASKIRRRSVFDLESQLTQNKRAIFKKSRQKDDHSSRHYGNRDICYDLG